MAPEVELRVGAGSLSLVSSEAVLSLILDVLSVSDYELKLFAPWMDVEEKSFGFGIFLFLDEWIVDAGASFCVV